MIYWSASNISFLLKFKKKIKLHKKLSRFTWQLCLVNVSDKSDKRWENHWKRKTICGSEWETGKYPSSTISDRLNLLFCLLQLHCFSFGRYKKQCKAKNTKMHRNLWNFSSSASIKSYKNRWLGSRKYTTSRPCIIGRWLSYKLKRSNKTNEN